MNLFRNQHKFEKKLKDQLDGLEFKPSDAMWDRIDSNLPEDGFEKTVRSRLEQYELKPRPETWQNIEHELPAAQRRTNLRYYWFSLLAVLFSSAMYFGVQLVREPEATAFEPRVAQAAPAPAAEGGSSADLRGEAAPVPQSTAPSSQTTDNSASHTSAGTLPAKQKAGTTPASAGQQALPESEKVTEPAVGKTTAKEAATPTMESAESRQVDSAPKEAVNTEHVSAGKKTMNTPAVEKSIPVASSAQKTTRQKGTPKAISETTDTRAASGNADASSLKAVSANTKSASSMGANDRASARQSSLTNNQGVETVIPNSSVQPGTQTPSQSAETRLPEAAKVAASAAVQHQEVAKAPATAPSTTEVKEITQAPDTTSQIQQKPAASESPIEELSRISISIHGGANYCFNQLSSPSGKNFDRNIALRNDLESPDIDWAGGFLLNVHLNDRISVSAGVGFLNFTQRAYFDVTSPRAAHMYGEAGAVVSNSADSIVLGRTHMNYIKYSWTEVPLYVTYTVARSRRLDLDLMAGVSYGMISGVDAGIISQDNVGIFIMKNKDAFPGIKNNFFVNVNPVIAYKFTEKLSIGLMPTFKYSMTSITANENWVEQRPYFFGASLSMKRRF